MGPSNIGYDSYKDIFWVLANDTKYEFREYDGLYLCFPGDLPPPRKTVKLNEETQKAVSFFQASFLELQATT